MTRAFQRRPAGLGLAAALAMAVALGAMMLGPASPARADGGETRTDPTTGISVTIPAAWAFMDGADGYVFSMHRSDNADTTAKIIYYDWKRPQTSREYAEGVVAHWKAKHPKYQYSEVSDATLAGLPAATYTEIRPTRTLIETVALKDGKVLELTLWAPNDLLASVRGELDAIQNSIRGPASPALADGGEIWTDPRIGLSVTLPSDWAFTQYYSSDDKYIWEDDAEIGMVRLDNENIAGEIWYDDLLMPQTSREYAKERLARRKAKSPEAGYSKISDTTLGGYPAAAFTETTSTSAMFLVFAVKGHQVLEMQVWAPTAQWASIQGTLTAIRNSVRFDSGGNVSAGAGGDTWTDSSGLRVTLPSTWRFADYVVLRDGADIRMERRGDEHIMGEMWYHDVETSQTAREVAEASLARRKANHPDYQYSEVSDATLDGSPAATYTRTNSPSTIFFVCAVKGTKVVEMHLWVPADQWASVQGEINGIQSSIRLP